MAYRALWPTVTGLGSVLFPTFHGVNDCLILRQFLLGLKRGKSERDPGKRIQKRTKVQRSVLSLPLNSNVQMQTTTPPTPPS
jgi:hypothetical protein